MYKKCISIQDVNHNGHFETFDFDRNFVTNWDINTDIF